MAEKLAGHGIPDAESEVITAAMAAATMVDPGDRVLVIGSVGLRDAVRDRGAAVIEWDGQADTSMPSSWASRWTSTTPDSPRRCGTIRRGALHRHQRRCHVPRRRRSAAGQRGPDRGR
ncbi:MAG: hypothetical protein R2695_17415 [Acidimicrobiales bacterium]